MALRPEDIRALGILTRSAAALGLRIVIVGANARWILAGESAGLRPTRDTDAVVAESTWSAFEALGRLLIGVGFTQSLPHRFRSSEGALIDLIPFGPSVVQDGRITWPTGESMAVLGLEEALSSAVRRTPAEGLELEIASEPAYVILKIVAYEERRHDRPHDVADLLIALEQYAEEGDRRFELDRVAVDDRRLTWEEAGAYLLGTDVRRIARPDSLATIVRFLDTIRDQDARPIYHAITQAGRTVTEERRAEVFRLFRAFRAGVLPE